MSKGNTFENDLLALIFAGTTITGLAVDDTSSDQITSLYLSLHTADPGEGGDQTTNEAAYTSYARVAVTRDSGGFTVSGNQVTLAANVTFPTATGGSETITHFAIGTASSGAGKILYKGTVTPNLDVSSGVVPVMTTGTTVTED